MSEPIVVSISHRLGKAEAARRLRDGLAGTRAKFGQILAIEHEDWIGDRLSFRVRALGQTASGAIDVFEDHVRLEVTLPWLLGRIAERLVPTIRHEGQLLLEKK